MPSSLNPRLVTALLVTLLAAVPATAAPAKPAKGAPSGSDLVKATLLADAAAVQPGRPFTLGLLMEITPEWHVYWKNPGDAGMPTKVKLQLPEGFKAGELQFPVPVRFDLPDGHVSYGYHDKVLHTIRVTPPADLKAGQDVTIAVKASWLVCKDLCLKGGQNLQITLPVSDGTPAAANEELFAEWTVLLPARPDASPDVTKWSPAAADAAKPLGFSIQWKAAPKDVQIFPDPDDALVIEKTEAQTEGSTTRVSFVTKVIEGLTVERETMPVVITYTDPQGRRRGVEVELPLASVKQ